MLIEADLEKRSPVCDSELERRMRERAQTVLWLAESGNRAALTAAEAGQNLRLISEADLARLRDAGL